MKATITLEVEADSIATITEFIATLPSHSVTMLNITDLEPGDLPEVEADPQQERFETWAARATTEEWHKEHDAWVQGMPEVPSKRDALRHLLDVGGRSGVQMTAACSVLKIAAKGDKELDETTIFKAVNGERPIEKFRLPEGVDFRIKWADL